MRVQLHGVSCTLGAVVSACLNLVRSWCLTLDPLAMNASPTRQVGRGKQGTLSTHLPTWPPNLPKTTPFSTPIFLAI